MITVKYLKEFTTGILKGLTFEDELTFTSLELAIEFTNLKEVKNAFGGSDYKIIWSHITTSEQ